MSPTVKFQCNGQAAANEVSLEGRHSLLTFARFAHLPVPSICGGHGTCGKCKLRIIEGSRTGLDPVEERLLGPDEIAKGWRLSCRLFVEENLTVEIPTDEQSAGPGKGITAFSGSASDLDPAIAPIPLPQSAGDTTIYVDEDSLLAGLGQPTRHATLSALQDLVRIWPSGTEDNSRAGKPWAVGRGNSVIDVMLRRAKPRLLGVAIDVGTTTLAAYLVDLETGEELAAASAPNGQAYFGADVMSRADHALHGGAIELQDTVLSGINGLIEQLCVTASVSPTEIYEATVAGNSCMHHLLLGLQLDYLAKAPYRPVLRRHLELPANELKLNLNREAQVYCFPLIGGFVGGDIVADLLATRLYASDRPRLLIDFGTNAEIVLGSREGIVACSTAAGPAFEGGRIRCGMRAADGAITAIDMLGNSIHITTLGDAAAAGVSGSGLVDAVAVFRREGIIDGRGLFTDHPSVVYGEQGKCVILSPADEAVGMPAIVLTQDDIVEFQLARSAVRAGLDVLLSELDVGLDQIAEVLVAGAFGSALNLNNAQATGLLPPLPNGKATSAGNAAGAGAKLALTSVAQRRTAARIAAGIRYVELSGRADFSDAFANHLLLG